jgi:hypothetical protein
MRPKLRKSRIALARLLETANPEDEFCLSSSATTLASPGWTSDPSEITGALADSVPRSRTALLDAVALDVRESEMTAAEKPSSCPWATPRPPHRAGTPLHGAGKRRLNLRDGNFRGHGIQLSIEEVPDPDCWRRSRKRAGVCSGFRVNHLPRIAAHRVLRNHTCGISPARQHDGRHTRWVQVIPRRHFYSEGRPRPVTAPINNQQ